MEPVSLCGQTDSGIDYDGVNGELSNIEGSVCDSNYFDQICSPTRQNSKTLPINVEKYKIQRNPNSLERSSGGGVGGPRLAPIVQESDDEYTSEVPVFSDETLRKLAEKEKMLKEYEAQGIIPGSDSEYENESDEEDADDEGDGYYTKGRMGNQSCLKRLSSDSGNIDTASLNDLNKTEGGDQGSTSDLCLVQPNINVMASEASPTASGSNIETISKGSLCKGSNPSLSGESTLMKNTNKNSTKNVGEDYAIDKLKTALTRSNDGLVTLNHGKTPEHRLSEDTQEAMDQHRYRLTSSDC